MVARSKSPLDFNAKAGPPEPSTSSPLDFNTKAGPPIPSVLRNRRANKFGGTLLRGRPATGHPKLVNLLSEDVNVKRTFWLAMHQDVASLPRNKLIVQFPAGSMTMLPSLGDQ
jgi:hypothetical protein